MFDDPFVFFALVIAIVALIVARKAMNQVAELRQRLEAIQATPATAAVPPPLTPFEAFEQTLPPASTGTAPTPPPRCHWRSNADAGGETKRRSVKHPTSRGHARAGDIEGGRA